MSAEMAIRAFFVGAGGAAVFWLIKRAGEALGAYKQVKIKEIQLELDKIKDTDSRSGIDQLINRENSGSGDQENKPG